MRTGVGLALFALLASSLWGACTDRDTEPPPDLLERTRAAMASETFAFRGHMCATCDTPVTLEYAPKDRFMFHRESTDDPDYELLLDGEAYTSEEGNGWRQANAGNSLLSAFLIWDPRVQLDAASELRVIETGQLDGEHAWIAEATFDLDTYLALLPPSVAPAGVPDDEMRHPLTGAMVRFWIDTHSFRVLQMELRPVDPELEWLPLAFDYDQASSIPEQVRSTDPDGISCRGFASEQSARALLKAISAYRRTNGTYPPDINPAQLGSFLPGGEWPVNPFTGQPLKEGDGPGDITYVRHASGQIEFRLEGWDGAQAFYNTERWLAMADPAGPEPLGPSNCT